MLHIMDVKVGELVPVQKQGVAVEEIQAVYTVLDRERGLRFLAGEEPPTTQCEGVYLEPQKDWIAYEDGRLGYFSLIPYRNDDTIILIEVKGTGDN